MSWRDLLSDGEKLSLPWLGGRKVHGKDRSWTIKGRLPEEHGWHEFDVSGGRKAVLSGEGEVDPDFETVLAVKGYLVGDRLVPDQARVEPDPDRLWEQTAPVHLVEPGLERFARAVVCPDRAGRLIYVRQEFPEGPEMEVQEAYQDRLGSVSHVKGVTPALDLAFRFVSQQRLLAEERRREAERRRLEAERKRQEEEKLREAMRNAGTGVGRRVLAAQDFDAAARAALTISGAQLLDTRPSYRRNEMVVQYRFRRRRLECVVDRQTLQVIDSGICLTDHHTGEQGDTYFTLESLPAVVGQAMDEGRLVVYRHA